ncbi:MAG: ROK family transcriptional regulator [Anaerolineae bacterium]|nr:ROK family transcriptional regulator [Anaerolineae bacterium]
MSKQGQVPRSTRQIAPFSLQSPEAQAVASIRKLGPLSRTDIADVTGYSRSKITAVVNTLTSSGILEEVGDGVPSGGRRSRILNFRPGFGYIIGVDMGATSVDIALADFNGHIIERCGLPMDVREGPTVILPLIRNQVLDMAERCAITPDKIYAFGIGVPGPVEFSTGLLIAPPIMPGWEAFPIRAFIQETFTSAVVIVDNDVNVMALGELRGGAGVNEDHFIYVKIGTGIGCGIVCHRQIYRGVNGSAGDIGHICADQNGPVCHCGNIGCLEAVAAGPAIALRATQAALSGHSAILTRLIELQGGTLSALDVGQAAREGDRAANEIIHESGRMIGEVLASLVNFFNPSLILIGGGVSNVGHQFLASIRRGILHRSLPLATRHLRIDVSPIGADAGVKGAIALAMEHVFVVANTESIFS